MWRPILDGSLQVHALATIKSITTALSSIKCAQRKSKSGRTLRDSSLAGGSAGLAIFYAYLDQARPGFGYDETALCYLNQAMEAVSSVQMGASLYAGLSGVGWTVNHLCGQLLHPDKDATEAVDSILTEHVSRSPWLGDYDLIGGLVGFGVYALEQLPNRRAVRLLAEVVDRLEETAERTHHGTTWFTKASALPKWQRELCPHGYYNTGMAHGIAGVIAFLARVSALEQRGSASLQKIRKRAIALLDGAVAWLLAQKRTDIAPSAFPDWIGRDFTPGPGRVAWCYGDLGIAAALLLAGRSRANAGWKREALRLGKTCADRSVKQSGARDCGVCHGAAGIAHLFNRMFQFTGDVDLKKAARKWFRQTFKMRRPGRGIAGFSAYRVDGWADEIGFLEGAAGIGLALLAATNSIESEWDRVLLIS